MTGSRNDRVPRTGSLQAGSLQTGSGQLGAHPLTRLRGVGPQLAARLERLGIREPRDLLFHLPLRYQDRTRITPVGALRPGSDAVVVARVELADIRFGKRRSLLVQVSDDTGLLTLRFFHFSKQQQNAFVRGHWITCYGEARPGPATIEMVHPEYRISEQQPEMPGEASLTPVYPATEGVGPGTIRRLVSETLEKDLETVTDALPEPLRRELSLVDTREAISYLHHPPSDANVAALSEGIHPMQRRLALEELTAHHLALHQIRQRREGLGAPALGTHSSSWERLQPLLGFSLTSAQERVVNEIVADLSRSRPSLRLVQGDVGSGKTVVAAAGALHAIDSGYQAALMAPTELLAEQHRNNFSTWFEKIGIRIEWLAGRMGAAARRASLESIAGGEAAMVVGTHALFQEGVEFHRLGLVIVDELHRFGVGQRLALRGKGEASGAVPHQLIMSATPIPRSLAMIFYADLDISSIDELPPGRKPVTTVVMPDARREEIMQRIHGVCLQGQQVYWVCPLIEESENLQAQAATETRDLLAEQLPDIAVGLVHGRMKAREKDQVMQAFRAGEYHLLVATTVIEVGVDVPNASLMVIENAERLGLAQLHQLRGRVGRGAEQANCVLIYKPPLGRQARERLALLRESNDGFVIAQKDLEQRGPGDLLGTRQTGLQQMRIADLARDRDLLPRVESLSRKLRQDFPEAVDPLVDRWISEREIYANV